MKNKKLLYILIPATGLLWGMIIYKVFNVVKGSNTTLPVAGILSPSANEMANDTFSIHSDYRDPFSGRPVKRAVIATTPDPNEIKPVVLPTVSAWPSLVYGGIIKNQQSNKQLVLVQINGQGNIMTLGDKISDVVLTKIFHDSIEVSFGKEKKFIKK